MNKQEAEDRDEVVDQSDEAAYEAALKTHGLLEDEQTEDEQTEDERQEPEAKADDQEQPEPFEGFKKLDESQQKSILAALAERDDRAKQYEMRWKSQHGQLAPIQQQAMRLLEENKRLQAQTGNTKASDQSSEKLEAMKARFRENFPDDAEALDAFLSPVTSLAEQTRAENQALREQLAGVTQSMTRQQEIAALSDAHPDWKEHTQHVDGWIEHLDPVERELAMQWRASESSQDNIRLLNMYKRDLQLAQLYAQQQGGEGQPAPKARKRAEVDPSPRNRQSAVRQSNGTGSAEEDAYVAALERRGLKV